MFALKDIIIVFMMCLPWDNGTDAAGDKKDVSGRAIVWFFGLSHDCWNHLHLHTQVKGIIESDLKFWSVD